jgi:predicted enzyme related to lactoylglutathione lyase
MEGLMPDATASAASASTQATAIPRGRMVWYELMTTDPQAAQDFYTKIVGWTITKFEGGEQPYSMWTAPDGAIGGVMELPEDARKMGAPSHWIPYVAVDDVDATVRQAKQLGATTYVEGMDIPSVGRIAVLGDPQGATFAIYRPEGEWQPVAEEPSVGHFSWHELMTSDYQKAFDFYNALFGWEKTAEMDMGEQGGIYQMFSRSGAPSTPMGPLMLGGMMNIPPGTPMPPAWILYVMIDDVDATVERVKQLGGQILYGPMEVPGGDRVATATDPQGAVFGMHTRKKD